MVGVYERCFVDGVLDFGMFNFQSWRMVNDSGTDLEELLIIRNQDLREQVKFDGPESTGEH